MWEMLHFMISLGRKGGIRSLIKGFLKLLFLPVLLFFILAVLSFIAAL